MHRKLAGALVAVTATAGLGTSIASGQGAAPASVTIKQKGGFEFKPNQYIKDLLRWDRNTYTVRSGGTVKVVNTVNDEGPHTFTIVRRTDLPSSFNCKVCDKLGKAHGADPESDAPPKFPYLEDGVGQKTAPDVDKPGDSGVTGSGKKNESISFRVTAPKGSTLSFMCIIHPWMQATLKVR